VKRLELKDLLTNIKENNYEVPKDINPFDVALTMLDYTGDLDGELRDSLIFSTLYTWIMKDVFTTEEIRKLLNLSLDDNHLLYGIGEINDSVFTRTFSVLNVALALYKHREKSYLSKEEISIVFQKIMEYYENDKDVRGYIEGKGWAHGAAHGADAIDELVRCEEIGSDETKRILESFHKKININDYSYIHEEDERIVTAVKAILDRKIIDEEYIIEWVKGFGKINKTDKYPEDMVIHVNVKDFLRSLYFRLFEQTEYNNIVNTIKEILKEMNKY